METEKESDGVVRPIPWPREREREKLCLGAEKNKKFFFSLEVSKIFFELQCFLDTIPLFKNEYDSD
jgi:hypothetical protein